MTLPNAAILHRLTEQAWTKRSRDEQGLLDRVHSAVHSVLRRAEEAARKGLKEVSVVVMTINDASDVEVLERVRDELLKTGCEATLRYTWTDVKINNAIVRVSWFPKKT